MQRKIRTVVKDRARGRMHRHTRSISQMIRESWDQGEPAGWFEEVYAAAERGEAKIPWLSKLYNGELTEWLDCEGLNGQGKTALVIGCGLGDDAEELDNVIDPGPDCHDE